MSGLGSELQRAPSLQHARQHLYRSTSDIQMGRKHHLHPHIHHGDKSHKDEKSIGSSLLASISFDGTKSVGITPNVSHSGSRRNSVLAPADDHSGVPGQQFAKSTFKEADLKVEKEKSALRAALVSLYSFTCTLLTGCAANYESRSWS
jgi:hypothetical protein